MSAAPSRWSATASTTRLPSPASPWFTAAGLPAYGLARLAGWLTGMHPGAAHVMAVAVFAACGLYQLTPLKDRCLAHCRSPLGLLLHHGSYRGRPRDLRVGVHHGGYCLAARLRQSRWACFSSRGRFHGPGSGQGHRLATSRSGTAAPGPSA